MSTLDKWSILAGLRFVLASIVAFTHLGVFTQLGWLDFIPKLGAFEAILGFLLISGYSITVSYLREPEHFLFRRFQRIYPTYFASMVIMFLVVTVALRRPIPSASYLIANLLLLNQLFTTTSFVIPAWSLALEIWLYCLTPVLLMIRPQWTRVLVYVSFLSYLLYVAGETLLHLPSFGVIGHGGNLLFLSFVWICGLRLAQDPEHPGPVLWDLRLIFAGHFGLETAIQIGSFLKHHRATIVFYEAALSTAIRAATLCLVYLIFRFYVLPPQTGRQRSRLLRFLGDVSYPLYLIHISIYMLFCQTRLKSALAYYLITLALSAALYWSVDVYSKRRHLKLQTA